ncbi:apolipoprotein D [Anabrus simplex]|uniref:apolipoprotein D n=1 Tax=Anabrus simplex TaxID=316456 RepID=UPI0035A2BBDF
MTWRSVLLLLTGVTLTVAQIPGLGSCPQYVPMNNFDMTKFMGMWYETERMFQVIETASRCIAANYTNSPDGKIRVQNHVTSRITGIKRILEGELKFLGKQNEGKMSVKYSVLPGPLPIETEYTVLDTDYKSYAVLWHCSSLVPFFNTQNAWIMTRERNPPGTILQEAYGVLDKYNIPRTSFFKTIQENCDEKTPVPTESSNSISSSSSPASNANNEPAATPVAVRSSQKETPAVHNEVAQPVDKEQETIATQA